VRQHGLSHGLQHFRGYIHRSGNKHMSHFSSWIIDG
jgi:hypothetical protein